MIWVHGVHNMTFGTDYRRQQINRASDPNARGQYTFTGLSTASVVNGVPVSGTGFDFAELPAGRPRHQRAALRQQQPVLPHPRVRCIRHRRLAHQPEALLQLRSALGLRFTDHGTQQQTGQPGYRAGIRRDRAGAAGTGGTAARRWSSPDRNNISPRIGFACGPSPRRPMVIRGGYGTYYNTSVYNTIANNMAQQPPFAQIVQRGQFAGQSADAAERLPHPGG